MKVLFFLFPLIISLHGRKILEVQVKTSSDNDAGEEVFQVIMIHDSNI